MTSKVKILFVILQMKAGGSEKLVLDIISELDRSIYSPSIAWFKGFDIIDKFKKLNIPMYYIPKKKRVDLLAIAKLSKIIKENKIQIVNVHHFMPLVYSYYGCKIANKIKLVYTEHSIWEIEQRPLKWNMIGGYFLRNADAIIGVSKKIADHLQKVYKLPEKKVYTVPNGVNFHKLFKKKDFNFFVNIPNTYIKIVMVANFRKNKNHVFLLNSFNELCKIRNNVHLILIGQGFKEDVENSENEVKTLITKLGLNKKVTLLGYCDNVQELLCYVDIACLTSEKEGLPISLIEAMAARLPVIGTNVEGIEDVIFHNYNGYLVSMGDVKGFSNALNLLVTDEKKRKIFGNRSQEIAFNLYSMDKCIQKYQDIFVSLVNQ